MKKTSHEQSPSLIRHLIGRLRDYRGTWGVSSKVLCPGPAFEGLHGAHGAQACLSVCLSVFPTRVQKCVLSYVSRTQKSLWQAVNIR